MATLNPDQVMQTITKGRDVLQQGNRLVLMAHGRWHYLTLSTDESRIVAVNFMSPELAASTMAQLLPNAALLGFDDISATFLAELAEKVLPDAESYRPMLANGRCRLLTGHTTDTLEEMAGPIDSQIDAIQQLMNNGKRGPYLSFR